MGLALGVSWRRPASHKEAGATGDGSARPGWGGRQLRGNPEDLGVRGHQHSRPEPRVKHRRDWQEESHRGGLGGQGLGKRHIWLACNSRAQAALGQVLDVLQIAVGRWLDVK